MFLKTNLSEKYILLIYFIRYLTSLLSVPGPQMFNRDFLDDSVFYVIWIWIGDTA